MLHCLACDGRVSDPLHELCSACEFLSKRVFPSMGDYRITCQHAVRELWRTPLVTKHLDIERDAVPEELLVEDYTELQDEDLQWLSSLLTASSLRASASGSLSDGKVAPSVTPITTENVVRRLEQNEDGSFTVIGVEKVRPSIQ